MSEEHRSRTLEGWRKSAGCRSSHSCVAQRQRLPEVLARTSQVFRPSPPSSHDDFCGPLRPANANRGRGYRPETPRAVMLRYVYFGPNDLEKAIAFYNATLEPLGMERCVTSDAEWDRIAAG